MKQLKLFTGLLLLILPQVTNGQSREVLSMETKTTSMVFSAQTGGSVTFLYWGAKIDDKSTFDDSGSSPLISTGFGNPALRMTYPDGVLTTELVYTGSETKKMDDNRTETVLYLKDRLYPLNVDVHFISYYEEDIISEYLTLKNNGKETMTVNNAASSCFTLKANDYYLTHFHGGWANERQLTEEKLTHGEKVIESTRGFQNTFGANPSFLLSLNNLADENYGEVYGGSLAWSGNYKLNFKMAENGELNILAGINPFASEYPLKAGQTFQTPEMLLTYSATGKGQISRNFHDYARRYALAHGDNLNAILLNSWEGAYFNFDEKTLTDMMDNAAAFGIEMFVLDDGWFGNNFPRNNDKMGLGDWQTNKKKLPRGIGYLADYAVNKGLRFGIWIEPEMVNPQSDLARARPEWIVKSGQRENQQQRNQWMLDLSNPQVQDFIVKTFDEVLTLSPNITYIKWDCNRYVTHAGSEYLPKNEQTRFWHDCIRGLYSAYQRIRAKHPDVEIQVCSSGGGRVDFGALRYHDEFWASDNTFAFDRIFIQWGTSMFFPAQAMAAHVSASPNHQTGETTPLKFRFDVAMQGRLGMELQPADLDSAEYAFAKQGIATYKQIRPIVQLGDLYRLQSPYNENNWSSLMYVSKDKSQAVFFAYSLKYHHSGSFHTKLNGLDANKKYRISELNAVDGKKTFAAAGSVFSGDYLMKAGIGLNLRKRYDSAVLLIERE